MIIGIDLGTTNSLVGIWKDGKATLIPNALGQALTPSVVSIDKDGSILIGQAAKERLISHPQVTASIFKRFIGSEKTYRLGKHNFSPIELSSLILKALKTDAETYLNENVSEAVITVPAYFNDHQRQATKHAAEIAGLKVHRLLNEPTAAAMAYGLHEKSDDCKFLVLALGGGTFDVTLLELFAGVMEVRASAGDNSLGGEDFTQILVNAFITWQQQNHQIKKEFWLAHESLLYAAAESAKRQLSSAKLAEMQVNIDEQTHTWQINEQKFDELCEPLWQRFRSPIEQTIRDSNQRIKELEDIVLVGGATRMPLLRQYMTKLLGRFPSVKLNPDETIAIGACIQAGLVAEDAALDEVIMTDVAPYSLGVETSMQVAEKRYQHGIFSPIIERNTIIPTSKVHSFYATQDKQEEVKFNIYQGEARLVRDNIKLGEMTVPIPKKYHNKATEIPINVRFSYDVNGLLEVDIDIEDSTKEYNLAIQNGANQLSAEEITESKNKLHGLKIHPRDQAESRNLLARAERLYSQRLGYERDQLARIITWYENVLDSQDPYKIRQANEEIRKSLEQLENDDWL